MANKGPGNDEIIPSTTEEAIVDLSQKLANVYIESPEVQITRLLEENERIKNELKKAEQKNKQNSAKNTVLNKTNVQLSSTVKIYKNYTENINKESKKQIDELKRLKASLGETDRQLTTAQQHNTKALKEIGVLTEENKTKDSKILSQKSEYTNLETKYKKTQSELTVANQTNRENKEQILKLHTEINKLKQRNKLYVPFEQKSRNQEENIDNLNQDYKQGMEKLLRYVLSAIYKIKPNKISKEQLEDNRNIKDNLKFFLDGNVEGAYKGLPDGFKKHLSILKYIRRSASQIACLPEKEFIAAINFIGYLNWTQKFKNCYKLKTWGKSKEYNNNITRKILYTATKTRNLNIIEYMPSKDIPKKTLGIIYLIANKRRLQNVVDYIGGLIKEEFEFVDTLVSKFKNSGQQFNSYYFQRGLEPYTYATTKNYIKNIKDKPNIGDSYKIGRNIHLIHAEYFNRYYPFLNRFLPQYLTSYLPEQYHDVTTPREITPQFSNRKVSNVETPDSSTAINKQNNKKNQLQN